MFQHIHSSSFLSRFHCQVTKVSERFEQIHTNSGQGTMAASEGVRYRPSTGRDFENYGEKS